MTGLNDAAFNNDSEPKRAIEWVDAKGGVDIT
jgi:hypothetical protein